MNQITVWTIALPVPLKKSFDYLPAPDWLSPPASGVRVRVPFGSRVLVGVFMGSSTETKIDLKKLKPVQEVLDQAPVVTPTLFKLCQWASQYYCHPLGEVLMTALPKLLRMGKPILQAMSKHYAITEQGLAALAAGLTRAPKQQAILTLLQEATRSEAQLKQATVSFQALKTLLAKKQVSKVEKPLVRELTQAPEDALKLNQSQQQALDAIKAANQFKSFLLAGVTGSGKTEVYLQAISNVLAQGKRALVLVPEISLTPQTVARFAKRFEVGIAIMHSGLNDRERALMWAEVFYDKAAIVIGTRSAIFAPVKNLGLIVVDEEHDLSFKSQSGFRYHARDLAVMRAHAENIPVVLGSATPSLNSFFNVAHKNYQLLTLPQRAGEAKAPHVRVIDLRNQKLTAGLSQQLLQAIEKTLSQKKQVLIFLNRRGFAPLMLCHHCGEMLECNRCDAKLIYHANPPRLICHHCEKTQMPPRICPSCKQAELMTVGQGTEQLEAVLTKLFKQHTVLRVDRDTAATRAKLEDKLEQIHAGKADILIGTQMLAKGHHFPRLGLSAIVDIDSSFFSLDFRAIERMAQLLVQVAGRSGRGEELGEVIIQTHQPAHPELTLLLEKGYFEFVEKTLQARQAAQLPPYSFQVIIRAESQKRQNSYNFLQQIKSLVGNAGVQAYGPMPAIMERKAGRFRAQLILHSTSRVKLKNVLSPLSHTIPTMPEATRVRWSIDVDPVEIL